MVEFDQVEAENVKGREEKVQVVVGDSKGLEVLLAEVRRFKVEAGTSRSNGSAVLSVLHC